MPVACHRIVSIYASRAVRRTARRVALVAAAGAVLLLAGARSPHDADDGLPVIRRTEYGVPHIVASSFHGAGMGLGYAQAEDYGPRVILSLLRAKGWMGRTFGRDSVSSDFGARLAHARVEETYHLLDPDTRAMYQGFADGVNAYIRDNPSRVPAWAAPVFHGHDVAATDIGSAGTAAAQRMVTRWLRRDSAGPAPRDTGGGAGGLSDAETAALPALGADADVGSNAWALAPSRTKSGRAILLRNPHLAWTAGYWEAHVVVPGKLDYYGDFRIGSAFSVVGGFNRDLGWATTNNAPDLDEVYELDLDPASPDRYLFDGASIPIRTESATAEYRTSDGMRSETRQFLTTPIGAVAHRTKDKLYVVRAGPDGEYRAGAQFLAMMRARSLAEWRQALAMRARATSNLTYADRAGNILTIWMGSVPRLPQASGGDSMPVPARVSADIWTRLITLDSLPQTLNPRGGYVHNENDAPHYANLNAVLDTARFPGNVERGELRLRSQHALQLIANDRKFSLEDVIRLKHSMRMLLADRVKPDLLRAVRSGGTTLTADVSAALTVLERWDNTVAPDSRGGLLFETWWRRYQGVARDSAYAERWSLPRLTRTPRGLGKPALAAESFTWAVGEMQRRYGRVDVPWGEVHRVRRGKVDVPVGGCSGALGCFRVLTYQQLPDGKRIANSGDGWVLAVEFGARTPRAYSVLAYGQNADSTSEHYADQAAMFARGEFKPVWLTEAAIKAHTKREYRPGAVRGAAGMVPPAAASASAAASTPSQEVELRVMTYNIAAGGGDLTKIAATIQNESPDVVALQEVDVAWSARSNFADQVTELAKALGMQARYAPIYRFPGASPDKPLREYGIALLSRFPITGFTNHMLTRLSTQLPDSGPLPLPGFLEARLDVRGTPVRVFNTHLDYRGDPALRHTEVRETLAILGAGTDPTLFFGDLNATPGSAELAPLLARLRDVWPDSAGAGLSYPAKEPVKRIDYVLASPHFRVRAARVVNSLASDHRPVVSDLVLMRRR